MFLCHFPSGHPAWELPSALPCGARTFLSHPPEGGRPRTHGPLHRYCSTYGGHQVGLARRTERGGRLPSSRSLFATPLRFTRA